MMLASSVEVYITSVSTLSQLQLKKEALTATSKNTLQKSINMPKTYVVHLGNEEVMKVAENGVAKRVLCEHVRESFGFRSDDLLFAIINSVLHGKGQDLFLRAFYESLQVIKEKKLQVPPMHVLVLGSDINAQTKFEAELRNFVTEKKLSDHVYFINKTLTIAPIPCFRRCACSKFSGTWRIFWEDHN